MTENPEIIRQLDEIINWSDAGNNPIHPADHPDTEILVEKETDSVVDLAEQVGHSSGAETLMEEFKIILAGFLTLAIPVIVIRSYILGKKSEFTDDVALGVRWVYSLIATGLAVAIFTNPFAAAVLLVVLASTTLALSLFLFAKVFYERYQINKEKQQLPETLREMNTLQQQAVLLKNHGDPDLEAKKNALVKEFNTIKTRIDTLKSHQPQLDKKLGLVGIGRVMDRAFSLAMAGAAVIGYGISLAFPPVGAAIVTVTLIVSLSYATTRLGYMAARYVAPKLISFGVWISEKIREYTQNQTVHESTSAVMSKLSENSGHEISPVETSNDDDDETETDKARPLSETIILDTVNTTEEEKESEGEGKKEDTVEPPHPH